MKKSLLELMLKIARSSLPTHPQRNYFPHWTFVIQNNSLIEWATNAAGDIEHHECYKHRISSGRPKVHSELQALRRASGLLDRRRGWEVINIRLNRVGNTRLSKPCRCCYDLLCKSGCERFWYSSEIGWLRI